MIELLALVAVAGIVWAMHRAETANDGMLKGGLGLLALVLMVAGMASILRQILGA